MDIHYWKLLAKYVAGEASSREVDLLEAWMEADPARRKLLDEMKQAWELTRTEEPSRTDVMAAWDELENRIEEDGAGSKSPSREARESRQRRPLRRRSRLVPRHLLSAAGGLAMILVAVLTVILWGNSESKVIVAQRGERSTIELVDGTQVHLNAESELTLLPEFGRGAREVQVEGEAYFSVARDEDRPFRVHTPEGVVEVVGTAFNVNTYPDEKGAQVAVTEGAVALHVRKSAQAAGEDTLVLRPRQLGVMVDRRLRALHRDVDLASHVAWSEGRLVFEDAPFSEVIRRLGRWYDLRIETHREVESIDRLNAVFDQESASEVISDIAMALDLQYEQEGEQITFYRRAPDASSATEEALPEE